MLNKIRNFLTAAFVFLAVVAYAYFKGLKQGVKNEREKNIERVQKNIVRAMSARAMLGDSDYLRRLRAKYRRV